MKGFDKAQRAYDSTTPDEDPRLECPECGAEMGEEFCPDCGYEWPDYDY